MVEEEALDNDTFRNQVQGRDSDRLAAHQRIDEERPGFAENAGYGCGCFACDAVNAEQRELARIGVGQGEQACGGRQESLAPAETVERHQHAVADLQRCSTPLPTASTRPTPSLPTTLGSDGRTGYAPWMRYTSFMLIGACSTPISTWSAPGAGGSGRSASSSAARFARRAPSAGCFALRPTAATPCASTARDGRDSAERPRRISSSRRRPRDGCAS